MSVDSKMFVTCGKEHFVDVVNSVVGQLNIWVRAELDSYWKNNTDAITRADFLWTDTYQTQSKLFTNGVDISGYNMEMLSIDFGCGDANRRSLNVFSSCYSDYSDIYEGGKIIFSIGHWGKNKEIMNQVAIALESFGDVYYDHNDCDDEDFVLVHDFCGNSSQFNKGE
jgi:hypothetical protein